MNKKSIFLFLFKISLVVIIFSYLLKTDKISLTQFKTIFVFKNLPFLFYLFFLLTSFHLITSYRWYYLLKAQGYASNWIKIIQFYFIGLFFNLFIPGSNGGDALRIYYVARENKGQRVEASVTTVLDRVIGLSGLVILGFFSSIVVLARYYLFNINVDKLIVNICGWIIIFSMIIVFLWGILFSRKFKEWHLWQKLRRMIPGHILIERMYNSAHYFRENIKVFWIGILLSLTAHTMHVIAFIKASRFFIDKGGALQHFIFWPIIILISTIPITPGGLGVAEFASEKIWACNKIALGGTIYLFYRTMVILLSLTGFLFYLLEKNKHL